MSESSPKEGSEVAPEVLTDGVINVIDLDASCGQVQEAPPETPRKHTVGHARERRASISFSRSVSTSEIGGFMRSFGNGSQSTHRSSIRSKGGVPEGLERAVTMVRTYPIMSVEDTAFVNQIRRGSTGDSMEMSVSNMPDVSMGAIGEGEAGDPLGESTSNLYKTAELIRPITSAVALASRIKRACMWETVIVHFLSQRAWNETYRRNRLRAVLERHLLPVILRSRPDKSKPARFVRKTSNQPQKLTGKDAEQKAQSTFLMEHVPFFTALRSVRFCEAISEAVVRYRYVCGQAIVTPGLPSQNALYVLVSGMCDAIQSASETNPKVQRRRLKVGESFGGVLGGRAVFTELYRAISTCLVWVVTREDFESLFREYADAHMKSVFLQALKEHELERLQQIYPLPQCLSRVPIYRKSERLTQQLEQYMKGFSPIVKIKGDVLFSQGDPPGDIYCLVEGHVLREQVGPDMKYESGTRQILSPNEASNFLLSTRFVLLGEEPHVLQGLLRYRCTVVSRAALLYKIDSESFVNMLLDDAKLLIQLRKKHKEQLQQWMRLTPEALMQVPMLKDMPRSNLNAVVQVAEPRVLERYAAVCEPAQSIREVFLITQGDVRDPRQFDHVPTLPPPGPPSESEAVEEEPQPKLRKDKGVKHSNLNRDKPSPSEVAPPGRGAAKGAPRARRQVEADMVASNALPKGLLDLWLFQDRYEPSLPAVYPDEQLEITPPLPLNPAKNIVCTVGGGWEGLLVEKWPSGWETTTTVELWALPVLTIRTEFNSVSKALQNMILRNLSEVQMRELDLPAPLKVKLPPMSVYVPNEQTLPRNTTKVPMASASRSRSRARSAFVSHNHSGQGTLSKEGSHVCDPSESYSSVATRLSSILSTEISHHMKRHISQTKDTPKAKRKATIKSKNFPSKVNSPVKLQRSPTAVNEAGTAPSPEVPKNKGRPPPLLLLRRIEAKVADESPKITPEMRAMYSGVKPQEGIIRGLPQVTRAGREGVVSAPAPVVADNWSQGDKTSWPVPVKPTKQWFPLVPSFAPLPGTRNVDGGSVEGPVLLPNAALMVQNRRGRNGILASQVSYFTSLANTKLNDNLLLSLPSQPLEQREIAMPVDPTLMTALSSRPTPGRHAYRL